MFDLPYDTTFATRMYKNLDTLKSKIRMGGLHLKYPEMSTNAKRSYKGMFFVTPSPEHRDVPAFTQYLNTGTPTKPSLILDGRQYLREDRNTGAFKTIADNDWSLQSTRMALNIKLLETNSGMFLGFGDLPARVFGRWISGILTAKFQLSVESQIRASIICTYYYYAMINPELRGVNQEAREMFAINVSRVTGAVPDMVYLVLSELGPLNSILDLCSALSNNTGQQRTGEIKYQDLILLLSTSWFGINHRENVAISLEHLPTFIAIVFMALTSGTHKKTVIAQRALTAGRPNEIKSFIELVWNTNTEQLQAGH